MTRSSKIQMNLKEMTMSSKEFVNALMGDDNITAETAFKSAMIDKVGDSLEKKRIEISKGFVGTKVEETDE